MKIKGSSFAFLIPRGSLGGIYITLSFPAMNFTPLLLENSASPFRI